MKKNLIRILSFGAVLSFLLVGVAFADQAAGAAAASAAPVSLGSGLWAGILNGFLSGLVAVFYGYAKNRDPKTGEMESFDIAYAWPTIVVGGLMGVVAHFLKMTPQDLGTALTTSPIYGAVTYAAEAVLKAVFRHSVPWIRDAAALFKAAPAVNPTASAEVKPPTQ